MRNRFINGFLLFLCFVGGLMVVFNTSNVSGFYSRFKRYTLYVKDVFSDSGKYSVFTSFSSTLTDVSNAFREVNGVKDAIQGFLTLFVAPFRLALSTINLVFNTINVLLKFFTFVLFGGGL